jgi:hypothetical protein
VCFDFTIVQLYIICIRVVVICTWKKLCGDLFGVGKSKFVMKLFFRKLEILIMLQFLLRRFNHYYSYCCFEQMFGSSLQYVEPVSLR